LGSTVPGSLLVSVAVLVPPLSDQPDDGLDWLGISALCVNLPTRLPTVARAPLSIYARAWLGELLAGIKRGGARE
jgi:hypothetical protein